MQPFGEVIFDKELSGSCEAFITLACDVFMFPRQNLERGTFDSLEDI
jgi:hypothetical protein